MTSSEIEKKKVEYREDFIKRLFAVTISVGFAAQVTNIISKSGLNVSYAVTQHWKELFLLLIAMVAVVGSWEGYLTSILKRPLERFRFYLDVVIVFAYLLLMLCSHLYDFWYDILAFIFGLYAVWDVGSMLSTKFGNASKNPIMDVPWYKNSLLITGIWLILFLVIAISPHGVTNAGFVLTASSALMGVIFYRVDKDRRPPALQKILLVAPPLILLFIGHLLG